MPKSKPRLVSAPHTQSGVRYIYPHKGRWRSRYREGKTIVNVPKTHPTKEAAMAALLSHQKARMFHPKRVA